jgi:hypothetical protein
MDQAEEALRQHVLVAEAPFLHAAGLEVLDQHVGIFQQAQQHFAARRLRKIEADALLVAVDADEVAGVARVVKGWTPLARLVALRSLITSAPWSDSTIVQ